MSVLGEVIARLRGILEQLAQSRQQLRRTQENFTQAATELTTTLHGSTNPAAARTHAELTSARERTETALACVDRAEQHLHAYLLSIQGASLPVPDQHIDQIRTSLRPGVDNAQTTGWWLRPDGSRVRLRSGPDTDPNSWQQKAERFLQRTFPNEAPSLYALGRHVEIKLAIRSHEQPFDNEVLVIDRKVCGRDSRTRRREYSCDDFLPAILAEGARLTVVEHDGTHVTYVGRSRDDDQR
jgi:hypothetical protein